MKGVACLASLVVVSLSLGACGNYQTEVAKNTESIAAAFVDAEISKAEKRIHADILDNSADLPAAVSDYITLIRRLVDQGTLPMDAAARKLNDVAKDVLRSCSGCAEDLVRERARIQRG